MAPRRSDLPANSLVLLNPRAAAVPDGRSIVGPHLQAACFRASASMSPAAPSRVQLRPIPSSLAPVFSWALVPTFSTFLSSPQVHGQPLCPVWPGEWQSGGGPQGVDMGSGLESRQQHHLCAGGTGVRWRGRPEPLPCLRVGVQEMGRRCRPFPQTPALPHRRLQPPPQVVRGLSAGGRVFEYMTLSPCIPLSGGCSIPREHLRGAITFHNVCFRLALAGGGGVVPFGLRTCGSMSPCNRVPLRVQ